MLKPLALKLILTGVAVLALLLIPTTWGLVQSIRTGAKRRTLLLGTMAFGMVLLSAGTLYAIAPAGAQTLGRLELPDGGVIIVRSYRDGWLDYPSFHLYAQDTAGTWTSFQLVSELGNATSITLVLDAAEEHVEIPGVGWYRISEHEFVNPDGSRASARSLPKGIEPGDENFR